MFCSNCGKQLQAGVDCACRLPAQAPPTAQAIAPPPVQQHTPPPVQQQYASPPQPVQKDPRITCAVWSYVFIFWLRAFDKDYKDDPFTRFHAGQGMMLSIVTAGLMGIRMVVYTILNYIGSYISVIWSTSRNFVPNFYHGTIGMTFRLLVDSGILAFWLIFMFIGISAATSKNMKPLPVFGKAAFYK